MVLPSPVDIRDDCRRLPTYAFRIWQGSWLRHSSSMTADSHVLQPGEGDIQFAHWANRAAGQHLVNITSW